jgi:hypothetical protein
MEGEAVPYKPWSSTSAAPDPALDRPVWVDLEALSGPHDDGTAGADDPVPVASWSPPAASLAY